jgi:hypothetical protein
LARSFGSLVVAGTIRLRQDHRRPSHIDISTRHNLFGVPPANLLADRVSWPPALSCRAESREQAIRPVQQALQRHKEAGPPPLLHPSHQRLRPLRCPHNRTPTHRAARRRGRARSSGLLLRRAAGRSRRRRWWWRQEAGHPGQSPDKLSVCQRLVGPEQHLALAPISQLRRARRLVCRVSSVGRVVRATVEAQPGASEPVVEARKDCVRERYPKTSLV